MASYFDIWKMLAGVAFFLLAMNFMESTLGILAGRRFKLFLKKHTTSKLEATGGGVIVTGLLQSSSIVNLVVLNMVGAGVLKMENALALMLGSNLGTTVNSWILATIGFSYSFEVFVLPALGITGIAMAFISMENKWFLVFKFLFSLAFLFVALGYIKTGMEGFVKQTNLSAIASYPLVIFLLLGILLTAIVQSSSAVIALTLSALYANAITLLIAMAIVLGGEIGTTLKLFLAAAKGTASKKRVALGNFLFNLITVTVIFFLLRPLNYIFREWLPINVLAFFQSLVNLLCIILFLPFLRVFGNFLLKRFEEKDEESFYISKLSVGDMDHAIDALDQETKYFINHVIQYSLNSFNINDGKISNMNVSKNFTRKSVSQQYNYIKQLHGEMHGFYLKLLSEASDKIVTERLEQLISAIRNSMYAAKNIRDAQHDIEQMRNSSNDIKYNFYIQSSEKLMNLYEKIKVILNSKEVENYLQDLTLLYHSITSGYTSTLGSLYKDSVANKVNELEITTLVNFNRELYTSFKSILFGLKDYLLTVKEAEFFDTQPGFIR
jgi:phosphate:Na+ symporter